MSVAQLVALLGVLAYYSSELWLRRAEGKSFEGGSFDRRTTRLAASANLTGVILPWLVAAWWGALGLSGVLVVLLAGVLAAGIALRFWAMQVLGRYFTRSLITQADQQVVDTGPYRLIRHPGYLAVLLVLPSYGVLASGRGWVGALVLGLMILTYARRIPAEEEMLVAELGQPYEDYRARSWRILPGLY